MILVNRNFGNPVLASVIGDMFKGSSDTGQNVDLVRNSNALVSGSSLVASKSPIPQGYSSGGSFVSEASAINNAMVYMVPFNDYNSTCNNFYLVTEHFLKTLDKVYTKIWNESFTETGIYVPANLATMYHGFVIGRELTSSNTDFMIFKKFVDRCITAGILLEEDRLQYEDQIFLSGMSRANMSTQIDLDNKLVIMTSAAPIDVKPDLNGLTGQYLSGKKLFLMATPYLTNESVAKGYQNITQEPFASGKHVTWQARTGDQSYPSGTLINVGVKQPIAFFKPKTDASKFGRSLPLATHLIWSIGTPADEAAAIANNQTPPDLIFDHLDRISHIDSLVLKIKYDKLQF